MIIDPGLQPGEYLLEVDIVKEHEFWYKDKGNKTISVKIIADKPT